MLTFYLLAVVTEDFFVPAIDKIAHKLKLSSDAAGATLLAAGSSAPEFFIALFAVLGFTAANADVGAGAIVGSAIFNVLVIVGLVATFKPAKLQWQPILRDQGFYLLTILMLLWAFWDGQIVLYEALIFVVMYVVYVIFVTHWQKWLNYEDTDIEEQEPSSGRNRFNIMVHRALSLIMPNPHKKDRSYAVTFIIAILLIGGLSWILVEQVVVLANIFSIDPTFLALTVLAAGTSVPDLMGSIVVAKQGRGDMAVSNAVGSNIFNVLFGLGLPWIIVILSGQQSVPVNRENLLASVLLLFASVTAILLLLIMRRWRIGQKSGFVLIGLYVAYCVYIFMSVR